MSIDKSMGASELADILKSEIRSIVQEGREAGDDFAESFMQGATSGIKKHSKELKSEMTKAFEDFNRMTNNFKSRKSINTSEWQNVFKLSEALLKSDRYADTVRNKLSDIAVTFSNIGKVSGIDNIVKELAKAENTLEKVQWTEAGKNYKKKSTIKKTRPNSKPVNADPAPVVDAEKAKQKEVVNTTEAIKEELESQQKLNAAQKEAGDLAKKKSSKKKNIEDVTGAINKQADATKKATNETEQYIKAQEKLHKTQQQEALSEKEINHTLDVKNRYTGSNLKGKSDFINAIKYEWERGNKAVSAKLFDQYKTRFPGGTYSPSADQKFGKDWVDNYDKYLEQANRHIAELDKRLSGVANGVIEIQGEFRKFGDIAREATDDILKDVDLNPSKFYGIDKYEFADSDIAAAEEQLENARKKAQELKDEALEAKNALDEVSNIRSQYTGKFKGKSDLQAAIKDEWSKGNKAVAAKLFEQYQTRFPDGTFDPAKQKMFGDDWVNNHEKYLEQANRHIVELDTILNGMASDYGKYEAYNTVESFIQDKTRMLDEIKQNKLVGEVVRGDLDSRREAAKNKYATKDVIAAQENLDKVFEEFTRRQLVAKELFERRNKMMQAIENDDDISDSQLFSGYESPAQAISDISRQFSYASLDAQRFAITDMKEAVKVAKELGVEVNDAALGLDEMESKVLSDMLMRQKRFAMDNDKAGTPEKSQQIFDADKIKEQTDALREQKDVIKQVDETQDKVEDVRQDDSVVESNQRKIESYQDLLAVLKEYFNLTEKTAKSKLDGSFIDEFEKVSL